MRRGFLPSWLAAFVLAPAAGTVLAAAAAPSPAFPVFASAPAVAAGCDAGLAEVAGLVGKLEKHPPDAGWLAAWDDLNAAIEDRAAPVSFVQNVHPDPAVRDAAKGCSQRWSELGSSLAQNEILYRTLQRVQPRDAIERAFAAYAREEFEDAGVSLPAAARERAKRINDRVSELGRQFDARIRDANVQIAFTAAELAGVPERVWKDKPRDAEGRVLLGIDSPTLGPVMQRADTPSTRERMLRAKLTEGGDANLAVLAELVRLRQEYARLFGLKTFADFQMRRRMIETTAKAQRFLDEVRGAVTARELRDLAELREAKARHLGTPLAETRLERWDVSYYSDRLRRERYSVDQEAFRPYFPPEVSLRFVMKIAERMLGVRYTPVAATLWHEDARAYVVTDARTGRLLATLYVDLYPRQGKYGHAAVWPIHSSATRIGRAPQAALVANLDRKGLTLGELETLLHEMGHAFHNTLSATRYTRQSDTYVQWDFGEAPSQMLEDWVYDRRVLKLLAEVCASCPPVPDAMIDKARVARDFGKGGQFAFQLLLASYDLALYTRESPDPLALWNEMEGATPLGSFPGTLFPAGFAHIASGGYPAGYYGYLWSLVVALDLRTAFGADRLDPKVGARYRQSVLAQGRERPPGELVRDVLGRDTDAKAFFDDLAR